MWHPPGCLHARSRHVLGQTNHSHPCSGPPSAEHGWPVWQRLHLLQLHWELSDAAGLAPLPAQHAMALLESI